MSENVIVKQRSDRGRVILTPRDIHILLWMGEQFAIRFDHFQILAGRLSQNPSAVSEDGLSYKAAYKISTRWVNAGLVERKKIFVGEPMWLWLTKKGLDTIGLDLSNHNPAISRLAHIHAVNAVRLYVEQKVGDQARWICEREANALRKASTKRHLVDGELEFQDQIIALEIELTQKRKQRLNSIVRELARDYKTVWYFASDECHTAVKNGIEQFPGHKKVFKLYRLSSIMN